MNYELFTSMHDILDYIIAHYDTADESERLQFCQHIQQIKETNDYVMDHWVSFEEKLALFFEKFAQYEEHENLLSSIALTSPIQKQEKSEYNSNPYSEIITGGAGHLVSNTEASEHNQEETHCNECDLFDIDNPQYEKAIGYYKLLMFKESAEILHGLLAEAPECNRARLYYAMCLLHIKNWDEAKRQFQLLTVLSDFPKWLALSYNALGCIQAIKCHIGEAEKLFRRAYQIYPQFEDAFRNLQCCTQDKKDFSLYFGSTELISM